MNIGFAMCGSFCTYAQVFPVMEALAQKDTLIPIFSPAAYSIDSRFGTAQANIRRAAQICGTDPLYTIDQVEPIGPKKLLDALDLVIAAEECAACKQGKRQVRYHQQRFLHILCISIFS